MIRALLTFLRFLRIPTFIRGIGEDVCGRTTPVRNGQFASFMSVQGCSRRHHPDRHDRRLQFQKLTRAVLTLAGAVGFAWVALESAKALSVF
ncbi:MAG: hypothetical protein K0R17_1185 [Rariglobus sp.]|nr:hypothetical protein [Rariglobus sp.]